MSDLARLLQQYGYGDQPNALARDGESFDTSNVLAGMPRPHALANALQTAGVQTKDEHGFLFSRVGGDLKFTPYEAVKNFMAYRAPPGALSTSGDDTPVRSAADAAGWVGLSGLGLNWAGANAAAKAPQALSATRNALSPPRIDNPIRGYHGSRHDFTEFNGPTFVAQHEPVAAGYKPFGGGHMYEVNVHARPETFVDPRTPFSQQSEALRGAFASKIDELRRSGAAVDQHPVLANPEQYSVHEVSSALSEYFSPQHLLKSAGVPGFRHSAPGAPKNAPNLEVFDPALIEILRKYGLLGSVGLGAAANGILPEKDMK